MSRIGNKPINILQNVDVYLEQTQLKVIGPVGQLELNLPDSVEAKIKTHQIILCKAKNDKTTRAIYGLYRTLINNMVIGAHQGFTKHLVVVGVGYRAQMEQKTLILNVGYSHVVKILSPDNIEIKTLNNTEIMVSGPNKALVGQTAAQIRSVRPPEPYKGKGIRYKEEIIRRKIGKTGK